MIKSNEIKTPEQAIIAQLKYGIVIEKRQPSNNIFRFTATCYTEDNKSQVGSTVDVHIKKMYEEQYMLPITYVLLIAKCVYVRENFKPNQS